MSNDELEQEIIFYCKMNYPIDNEEYIDNSSSSVATTTDHSTNNSDDESGSDVCWFDVLFWRDDHEQAIQNYYDTLQQRQQQQNTSLSNTNTNMMNDIINLQDSRGRTALHQAINVGVIGCIEFIQNFLLSNNNIDITIQCNDGETPLHTATQMYYYEVVKLLLEHEEKQINDHSNNKNENDEVAFRATTTIVSGDNHHGQEDVEEEEEIMSMIYIRNNLGETPLHNAVEHSELEITKILLSYYAKYQKRITYNNKHYFNMPDNNGLTPIQLLKRNRKRVVEGNSIDSSTGLYHPGTQDYFNTINEILTLLQEKERSQRLLQIYHFIRNYPHQNSFVWSCDCFEKGAKNRKRKKVL